MFDEECWYLRILALYWCLMKNLGILLVNVFGGECWMENISACW